ncbi:MAG: fumarate reductase cytochrome b subunit [Betaproteobacteria bacterium]|jgi:fumarate reductase subunit C
MSSTPLDRAAGTLHASRWPARLDAAQSATGLLLGLFLCVHLLLDSAILIGPDAADWVARAFEGAFVFQKPQPWIISVVAAGLFVVLIVHAALAMRKLPVNWRQWRAFRTHNALLKHNDTRLWWKQALTGFLLFFLVAPHLWMVMLEPENIGAVPSATRIVEQLAILYYAVFLPVVVVHAFAGLYRLAVKWDFPRGASRRGVFIFWHSVAVVYLLLGAAALVAYVRYGLTLLR